MKIMVYLATFYAFGIYAEIMAPNLHSLCVRLLPNHATGLIYEGISEGNIKGFTPNSGFAAVYICAGIIAALSGFSTFQTLSWQKKILLAYLFIALLFTGKRGHSLFLFLSITIPSLIQVKGMNRAKKWLKLLTAAAFLCVIFVQFRDFLGTIPLIGRLYETVDTLVAGGDASNLRSGLYRWAWELFTNNPLLGIGWGEFRTTTIGNVSYVNDSTFGIRFRRQK